MCSTLESRPLHSRIANRYKGAWHQAAGVEMDTVSAALAHWDLSEPRYERFGSGLINETYRVTSADKSRYILQGLNAAFEPEVNSDIDVLTRHLEAAGHPTQRLVATRSGTLWAEEGDRYWRVSTYVPGHCFTKLETEQQAREAGKLLARFHRGYQRFANRTPHASTWCARYCPSS